MSETTKTLTPARRTGNMATKIISLAEHHNDPSLLDQGIDQLIHARIGMHKKADDLPTYNDLRKTLMASALGAIMHAGEDEPLSVNQMAKRLGRSYRTVWLELQEVGLIDRPKKAVKKTETHKESPATA